MRGGLVKLPHCYSDYFSQINYTLPACQRTAPLKRLFALLTLLASPALADDPLPLTYDLFEAAILHTDITECPPELAAPDRFCRATLYMDAFHIFVFQDAGDQPMVDFLSYDASKIHTLLKTPIPD